MAGRWLTLNQFALLYGLSYDTAKKLVRRGQLPARRFGKEWRIFDEGMKLAIGPMRNSEDMFMLRTPEVADLLGISTDGVKKLRKRGSIKFRVLGGRRFYTLSEVRRILAERQLGKRGVKKKDYRPGIVRWARKKLNQPPA